MPKFTAKRQELNASSKVDLPQWYVQRNPTQSLDCSAISALLNHCRVYLCGNLKVGESVCLHCFSLWIHNVLMCCYLVVHLAFRVEVRVAVGCKYPQVSWVRSFCAMLLWRKSSPSSFGRQSSQRSAEVCVSHHPWKCKESTPPPTAAAHFTDEFVDKSTALVCD